MGISACARSHHHDFPAYMLFYEPIDLVVGHEFYINFRDVDGCHIHRVDTPAVYLSLIHI